MTSKSDALPVTFLFRMDGHDAVGERLKVTGPMGGRYFSTPTEGGAIEGPRIRGALLKGYSWAAHRMKGADFGYMHYNVRVLIVTDDGHRIVMRYRGVNSPAHADGSWRTGIVFEAEDGPYAWLNDVVAIGVGRKVGADVEYKVYALDA